MSHEGELTAHRMAAGAANRHKTIAAQNNQTEEAARKGRLSFFPLHTYASQFTGAEAGMTQQPDYRGLLQFRIFGLGLLEDGNIGVGILPKREKILVGRFCFRRLTFHGVGAAQL